MTDETTDAFGWESESLVLYGLDCSCRIPHVLSDEGMMVKGTHHRQKECAMYSSRFIQLDEWPAIADGMWVK